LNGNADDIAAFIKTGTNTMPSFSVTYSDAEIEAIAKYIKTLPAKEAAK
jgi:mono/diheme cytochrome c family protein